MRSSSLNFLVLVMMRTSSPSFVAFYSRERIQLLFIHYNYNDIMTHRECLIQSFFKPLIVDWTLGFVYFVNFIDYVITFTIGADGY